MINREVALKIVTDHIPNKNLVKHCLAVEATMKALCKKLIENPTEEEIEKWGIVGLMHDADWEETRGNFDLHTRKTVEWLKETGETDEEIFQAILAHNYNHNKENPPSTPLEWSLYICDELTGFIIAVALILPNKKLADVSVESVQKKWNSKGFAAGVHRPQIEMCEEKLGIPLPEFINITLQAMKRISAELGL